MPNGLDDLSRKVQERTARREQRRQAPPPRHPRPAKEEQPPAEDPPAPRTKTGEAAAPPADASEQPAAELQGSAPKDPESESARQASRPGLTQIYLDAETEAWVWEVVTAAAKRRSRVPVSAIIRRALRELAARTTPEELAEEIINQPRSGNRGRPRL